MPKNESPLFNIRDQVFELRNGTPVSVGPSVDYAAEIQEVESQIALAGQSPSPETNPDLDCLHEELNRLCRLQSRTP
jgi:hypothetical protein